MEVGTQFARAWKVFFLRLERLHNLQRDDAHHLWLLHHLFLPLIDTDCSTFQNEWNRHQISGLGPIGKELSPLDMRFLSEAERGIVDDHENIHPNLLQQYYGVEDSNTLSKGTHEDTDDSDTDNETESQSLNDIQGHFEGNEIAAAHDAVPVPTNMSPFDSEHAFEIFQYTLQQIQDEEVIPQGYGVTPQEIQQEGYPTQEILQGGRRGRKEMHITLPREVWLPRAIKWCQALEVMTSVLVLQDLQEY